MWNFPSAEQVLSVTRAAHNPKPGLEAWLSGLVEAIAANFNQGAGVEGVLYDLSMPRRVRVEAIFASGVPATWKGAGLELHRRSPFAELLVDVYRSERSGTLAELSGDVRAYAALRARLHAEHGVAGHVLINGGNSSQKGCCFYLFSRAPQAMTEQLRWVFSELGAELAQAYRTRCLLEERERARVLEAPSELSELSDREQQIVDLAARGLSNKVIACELGVAFSTVRVLMARACAKLGVPSRSELLLLQVEPTLRRSHRAAG